MSGKCICAYMKATYLGDARTAFSWDLVASRDIDLQGPVVSAITYNVYSHTYHIDDVVRQFSRVVRYPLHQPPSL
jgi:hypothetical protein